MTNIEEYVLTPQRPERAHVREQFKSTGEQGTDSWQ